MEKPTEWPFLAWLNLAVRVFGLTPTEFWNLSVLDWLTLLSYAEGRMISQPMNRHKLSDLISNFPDGK